MAGATTTTWTPPVPLPVLGCFRLNLPRWLHPRAWALGGHVQRAGHCVSPRCLEDATLMKVRCCGGTR
eukprot:4764627-Heterocapsa_arctica.AAC.1